jgi:nitroreductase
MTMAATNTVSGVPFEKPADSNSNLHSLIRHRWSPRAFSEREVSREDLTTLLEAARWAASSGNEQPWRFIVASRENPAAFGKLLGVLVEANQAWARHASVLMIAVAKKTSSSGNKPNSHAWHDVGLALGNLVLQAGALGLHAHMMAGFDAAKAREVFQIPEDFEATTAIAVGYLKDPSTLPDKLREREIASRTRKRLDEIAFEDTWGKPLLGSEQSQT